MPDRRSFLAASLAAGALAATRAGALVPAPRDDDNAPHAPRPVGPIGCGLFSIPKLLSSDAEAAFALLQKLGYQSVELYGPFPFSVPRVQQEWQQAGQMLGFTGSGFFGRTPTEFRKLLDAHKLTAYSAHADLDTMLERLDPLADAAQVVGLKAVGLPNIPPDRRRTLDDYRRMADVLNELGARTVARGFKVLYHNHGYGWAPMQGQVPMRLLLERLDPAVIALEMDLFWTTAAGADPVELLTTFPKLYRMLHVKDMRPRVRFSGDGGDVGQWMPLFPAITSAGAGVLDLPAILRAAQRAGVEQYYVEYDIAPDPEQALGDSIRYLRGLTL